MNVLYVDAVAHGREWAERVLVARGHRVRTGASAAAGARVFFADVGWPDVLVVDGSLPVGDAVSVLLEPARVARPELATVGLGIHEGDAKRFGVVLAGAPPEEVFVRALERAAPGAAGGPDESGGFLVVEDQPDVARIVEMTLRALRPVTKVCTLAAARESISRRAWTGLVLDIGLPDGSGLDLLEELRGRGDRVPVLVLTGSLDPEVINGAHTLGAQFVVKPVMPENLRLFAKGALADATLDDAELSDRLVRVAASYQLTVRETELIALAARGVARRELADTLGIAENTVKGQLRRLLGKTGAGSYPDLARLLLER